MTTETLNRPTPISADKANEIADLFETTPTGWATRDYKTGELSHDPKWDRPGGIQPYTKDAGWDIKSESRYGREYKVGPASYLRYPAIADAVKDLPEGWDRQVSDVLSARKKVRNDAAQAERDAARRAAYEAIEHPAIRAHLLANFETRGYREAPKAMDLSWMAKLAASDRRQRGTKGDLYGPTPYKPQPGCNAKLHLKQAIHMAYVQDSYADLTYGAIPVTIENGADLTVCKRNLRAFADACRTHTGMAGSGSNFDLTLMENEGGVFVLFYERASIAD